MGLSADVCVLSRQTKVVTTATVTVLVLIVMTIAAESLKDYLEERTNAKMQPIVDNLFGELTIFGFLSIVVFVVTKCGFFSEVGMAIFGNTVSLMQIFDFVHYTLFFCMVLFVLQVFTLVYEAMRVERMWLHTERLVRHEHLDNHDWGKEAADFYHETLARTHQRFSRLRELGDLIPVLRPKRGRQGWEDLVLFKNLRDEFIQERSMDPPFRPTDILHQVDDDFNFGRYLSLCMSQLLTNVVHVSVFTWFNVAVCTVIYYGYSLAVDNSMEVLSWTWVAIAWGLYIFNVYFEDHLIAVRRAFAPKELFSNDDGDFDFGIVNFNESTVLNESWTSQGDLPLWTEVDMDAFMERRSWFARRIAGDGEPNRQQTFYWLDRKGPRLYQLILQGNLLFCGIYVAMNSLGFVPFMWSERSLVELGFYVPLALLPLVGILFFKQHLVSVLCQVCCMGTYRRPDMVSEVLLEEKTAQVVRSLDIIYQMKVMTDSDRSTRVVSMFNGKKSSANGRQLTHRHASQKRFDDYASHEVAKTFDAFDTEGLGKLTHAQFERFMGNLGAHLGPERIRIMIDDLDENGDGEVTKQEFMDWYADTAGLVDVQPKERARYLFSLFDPHGSGEVTIGDFKRRLDALNVGFTLDEVGAIVNELDEDHSGTIGFEEFENMLIKFSPEELRTEEDEFDQQYACWRTT